MVPGPYALLLYYPSSTPYKVLSTAPLFLFFFNHLSPFIGFSLLYFFMAFTCERKHMIFVFPDLGLITQNLPSSLKQCSFFPSFPPWKTPSCKHTTFLSISPLTESITCVLLPVWIFRYHCSKVALTPLHYSD